MAEPPSQERGAAGDRGRMRREVDAKERRKLEARRSKDDSVLFGFGMFGLVGWSVAIPTLIATALGVWIDSQYPGPHSWTLMLLIIGVIAGCLNAWFWVTRQSKE